ncbi:aminotransferase class I/II-fold pyridoxal phosphate-dependent enzyme [Citrobacter amalonaticus]|nr:aminotransferase class I/II-fold pyridoxal phosphate-dependent enzyme [Citrobacter amalonaticus]
MIRRPGLNPLHFPVFSEPFPLSPLIENNGTYSINWDDFREKLKKSKLFLFVSPHNPGGVVWDKETLLKIKCFCHKEGVIVISIAHYRASRVRRLCFECEYR